MANLLNMSGRGLIEKLDWSTKHLTFQSLESGTFSFSSPVEYSINEGAWVSLAANTQTPILNTGDMIKWRGNITPTSSSGSGTFSSTGTFKAMGNPLSLRDGDNIDNTKKLNAYIFYRLFLDCTGLIDSNCLFLPYTLSSGCFYEMYKGCSSLISPPKIQNSPSIEGSCYAYMFKDCLSIIKVEPFVMNFNNPSNYAAAESMFENCNALVSAVFTIQGDFVGSRCCCSMFKNCVNLNETIAVIPSYTTISSNNYREMFYNCKSLVKAPEIKVSQVGGNTFALMFYGCVSLTIPPTELNITQGGEHSFDQMFEGCTSLKRTPVMKNLNSSFNGMFRGCTLLERVECLIEDTTISHNQWLHNVAANGVFIKHPNATWTAGSSGIPSGWVIEDASINE